MSQQVSLPKDNWKYPKFGKHNLDLYFNSQTSNNQVMKIPQRKYCNILTQVIKETKHMHYKRTDDNGF